ncbi:hypothetical protein [Nonomuraea sp. NPDC003804]|uniref:hypothetical protein n=1 Tax=Nonomuraea sp. NPDC003804 TaxID=3154547 RepID=UPI0033AC6EDE
MPGARSRRRIRWIEGVSQVPARRLFGVGAWTVYGLAWVFVVAVPALRPGPFVSGIAIDGLAIAPAGGRWP